MPETCRLVGDSEDCVAEKCREEFTQMLCHGLARHDKHSRRQLASFCTYGMLLKGQKPIEMLPLA